MGMQPSQTRVDALNPMGRGLANDIFATMRYGQGFGGPGAFNPSQAPAFSQLFGGPQLNTGYMGRSEGTPWANDQWTNRQRFTSDQRGPLGSNLPGAGSPLNKTPSSGTRQTGAGFTGPSPAVPGGIPSPNQIPQGLIDQLPGGLKDSALQANAAREKAALEAPNIMSPGSFNLPGWGGPFGAPLTGGQMDAVSGINQIVAGGNNPLVSNEMIQSGLAGGMTGHPSFNPATQNFDEATGQYTTGSSRAPAAFDTLLGMTGEDSILESTAGGQGGASTRLNPIVDQIAPDLVNSFQTALNPPGATTGQGTAAFDNAINLAMAKANEQASSFGLSPGAVNRGQLMAGEAGQVAANLGLGQQNADTQAISAQNRDRVGAINSAGSFSNLLNTDFENSLARDRLRLGEKSIGASVLPALAEFENRGFENMLAVNEPAAQRKLQTLSMLPQFRNIPIQELGAMFGMNEAARGVADEQIQRQMGDFYNQQGGGLQAMLGALSGIPGLNTAFGPSQFSQFADLLGGIGSVATGLKG